MPAKLTRVRLRDYRSIGSCDVELRDLTMLVGPNGAGKSNFLDSLRFLAETTQTPLEQVLAARGGILSVLRKVPNHSQSPSFSITVDFAIDDGRTGEYSLTIAGTLESGPVIERECCQIGADQFTSIKGDIQTSSGTIAPAFTGDRPVLAAFGAQPAFAPVFKLLAGFRFFVPDTRQMRRPVPAGPGKILNTDASNAPDVLTRLEFDNPSVVERIRGYLKSINPALQEVSVTELDHFRWLAFRHSANPRDWGFNSAEVSDGTLHAVAILLAIFHGASAGEQISLVGLEEPENNLHPAAAGVLLDALLEASVRVPIIASTHSADLLDRADLPEASLLAVALEDGESIIGPIDEAGRSILRERLYTAGELMRSNLLSPTRSISTPR